MCHDLKVFKKQSFTLLHGKSCCCLLLSRSDFFCLFSCKKILSPSYLRDGIQSITHTHTHTLSVCVCMHFLLVCGPFSKLSGCVVCVIKHPLFGHLHERLGTQPKGLLAPDSVLKSPLKCTLIKLLEGESMFFLTFIPVITDVCGSWLWCSPPARWLGILPPIFGTALPENF